MGKTLLPPLIGGVAFVVFFNLLGIGILVSLAIAIAGYLAALLLLAKPSLYGISLPDDVDPGTADRIKKTVDEGYSKLAAIRAMAKEIKMPGVKSKVDAINEVSEKIFAHLKKNPKSVKVARKFLTYYLDSTQKILDRYIELSSQGLDSPEISSALTRAEDMLELIRSAFAKQLVRLLENDILDLDTEMSVLETTIKSEGL